MYTDRYRIALADDHAMFRKGLKGILQSREGLDVIGEAGDGLELLHLLSELTPDMVILDISMPNLRGIEAIHEVRTAHPDIKILVLTMHKEREYLHKAVSLGADGYLLKEDADPELFSAIDRIRQGKIYVSPRLSEGMVEDWAQVRRGEIKPGFETESLTTRESEVLKLIAEGKSNREIGELLFISVRTVERHRANIMDKVKVGKTADLVRYAMSKGFL